MAKSTGRNRITLQNFQRYEFSRFFDTNCKRLSARRDDRQNGFLPAVYKRMLRQGDLFEMLEHRQRQSLCGIEPLRHKVDVCAAERKRQRKLLRRRQGVFHK